MNRKNDFLSSLLPQIQKIQGFDLDQDDLTFVPQQQPYTFMTMGQFDEDGVDDDDDDDDDNDNDDDGGVYGGIGIRNQNENDRHKPHATLLPPTSTLNNTSTPVAPTDSASNNTSSIEHNHPNNDVENQNINTISTPAIKKTPTTPSLYSRNRLTPTTPKKEQETPDPKTERGTTPPPATTILTSTNISSNDLSHANVDQKPQYQQNMFPTTSTAPAQAQKRPLPPQLTPQQTQTQPTLLTQQRRQLQHQLNNQTLSPTSCIVSITHTSPNQPFGLAYLQNNVFYIGETDSLANLALLIQFINPTIITTSAKHGDELRESIEIILHSWEQDDAQGEDLETTPVKISPSGQNHTHPNPQQQESNKSPIPHIVTLKLVDFDYHGCFLKLQSLNVNNLAMDSSYVYNPSGSQQPRRSNEPVKIIRWASLVDLSKTHSIAALSGLLSFTMKNYSHLISPVSIIQRHPNVFPYHRDFVETYYANGGDTSHEDLAEDQEYSMEDIDTDLDHVAGNTTTSTTTSTMAAATTFTHNDPSNPPNQFRTKPPTLLIRPIPSTNVLTTDQSTRDQLSIFVTDYSGYGRTKEGLSVFSIMKQTKTKNGAAMLKQWLLYPSTDINIIQDRIDHVDYLHQEENFQMVTAIRKSLIGVKDIKLCFNRVESMSATYLDLVRIVNCIHTHLDITQLITANIQSQQQRSRQGHQQQHSHFYNNNQFQSAQWSAYSPYQQHQSQSLQSSMSPFPDNKHNQSLLSPPPPPLPRLLSTLLDLNFQELMTISRTITTICNISESTQEKRFVVRPEYDPNLSQLITNLNQIDSFLQTVLHADIDEGLIPMLPGASLQYVYIPYRGFFLSFILPPQPTPQQQQDRRFAEQSSRQHSQFQNSQLDGFHDQQGRYFPSQQQQQQQQQPNLGNNTQSQQQFQFNQTDQFAITPNGFTNTAPPLSSGRSTGPPQAPSILDITAQHGLVYAFSPQENEYLYITPRTDDFIREIGDIYAQIKECQHSIFLDLCQFVFEHSQTIIHIANLLYELDIYTTFALLAVELGLTRPIITSECCLEIEDGCHFLLDILLSGQPPPPTSTTNLNSLQNRYDRDIMTNNIQTTTSTTTNPPQRQSGCVPNSISIGTDHSKINIITGPNQGGKSMTLRTFGLITYLAHVGCFVPARSAVVGICDKLVCFQKVQDSINNNVSTFAADIGSLSYIINNATKYSLILLDEVGVGTTTSDAIGLFVGMVQYFRSKGVDSPKIIMTTHFHEILTYQLLQPDSFIRFYSISSTYNKVNLQTLISSNPSSLYSILHQKAQGLPNQHQSLQDQKKNQQVDQGDQLESITYLYKLVPGWNSSNLIEYGLMCARDAGIDDTILSRTRSLAQRTIELDDGQKKTNDVDVSIEKSPAPIKPISLLYFLLGEAKFSTALSKFHAQQSSSSFASSRSLFPPIAATSGKSNLPSQQSALPSAQVIIHFELNAAVNIFNEYFSLVKMLQHIIPSFTQSLMSSGPIPIKQHLPQLTPNVKDRIEAFIASLRKYLLRHVGGNLSSGP